MHVAITKSMGDSARDNIKDLSEFKEGLTKDIIDNFSSMNNKIEKQNLEVNIQLSIFNRSSVFTTSIDR